MKRARITVHLMTARGVAMLLQSLDLRDCPLWSVVNMVVWSWFSMDMVWLACYGMISYVCQWCVMCYGLLVAWYDGTIWWKYLMENIVRWYGSGQYLRCYSSYEYHVTN